MQPLLSNNSYGMSLMLGLKHENAANCRATLCRIWWHKTCFLNGFVFD